MSETSSCWKCGYSNLQSASKFCSQCAANLSNPLSGSSGGTAKTGISFSVLPKKCAACKRYLVTSGVMDKNGRYYHQNCFTCCVCRKPVTTGYHEVMGEDGHEVFYCAKDYAATKAALCATCGKPLVGVGVHDQMTGEKRHVECFVCNICRKPIVGKYVMDADSRLSCSSCRPAAPPALPSPGASSNESCCAGCGGELKGKLVGVGKTKFHSHCFLCIVCKTDLTNVPFSLDDGSTSLGLDTGKISLFIVVLFVEKVALNVRTVL